MPDRDRYGRIENTRELVIPRLPYPSCTRFSKSASLCSMCFMERSDGRSLQAISPISRENDLKVINGEAQRCRTEALKPALRPVRRKSK